MPDKPFFATGIHTTDFLHEFEGTKLRLLATPSLRGRNFMLDFRHEDA
jgi:hypothetical protein